MTFPPYQEDPWLAEMLGRPAYRLVGDLLPEESLPDPPEGFVSAHRPTDDVTGLAKLVTAGFRPIEVAMTFERPAPRARAESDRQDDATDGVRPAVPADREAVAAIARTAFHTDRFHADPLIGDEMADRLKESWATNFFHGARGDHLIVAESAGRVVGFLLLLDLPDVLVIDLIATSEAARGAGLGRAMIGRAVRELSRGRPLRVGTQASNRASIRLYEGTGFRYQSARIGLHRHSPATAG